VAVTVAVKVTAWPKPLGLSDDVMEIAVDVIGAAVTLSPVGVVAVVPVNELGPEAVTAPVV